MLQGLEDGCWSGQERWRLSWCISCLGLSWDSKAMDADLQRMDRFVQEIGSKMSTQERGGGVVLYLQVLMD